MSKHILKHVFCGNEKCVSPGIEETVRGILYRMEHLTSMRQLKYFKKSMERGGMDEGRAVFGVTKKLIERGNF